MALHQILVHFQKVFYLLEINFCLVLFHELQVLASLFFGVFGLYQIFVNLCLLIFGVLLKYLPVKLGLIMIHIWATCQILLFGDTGYRRSSTANLFLCQKLIKSLTVIFKVFRIHLLLF